jgi:hypothetical protein
LHISYGLEFRKIASKKRGSGKDENEEMRNSKI